MKQLFHDLELDILVPSGKKKAIIILLNCKVEKPNDSPLTTCLREWVAKLSIINNTFFFWGLKCTSSNSQNTFDVIQAIWFANTTHNLLATTFQSILGVKYCKRFTCFTLSAYCVYNKSKIGMVLLNYVPTNFYLC